MLEGFSLLESQTELYVATVDVEPFTSVLLNYFCL
jgi:hypothetical protein